jgi:hypothetical protein
MEFLIELWLPIVLSAVFVFVASSVLHMLLPIHWGDYGKLPQEEEVLAGLREHGLKPGQYVFPCPASPKEMNSPELRARYEQGPVGTMVVLTNGPPAMGKSLVQWFVYTLVISVFVAYLTRVALEPGASYLAVFRFSGTIAILPYAVTYVNDSIWKGLSWTTSLKFVFDGIVYCLVTAGTFGWLWPDAA